MKYGDWSELTGWRLCAHLQTAGTHRLLYTFSFFRKITVDNRLVLQPVTLEGTLIEKEGIQDK